ncbi:rhodanese-like domain-containing protein [Marinobacterium sp. LSUCC0821]|jgi:rhodanese-related sulfurtransferase|uniref:rhodanese-like domain-containing protein n=1 Tax=Marinobacterium sp. LSUCC0821 TaxID=2668067 RepID=UPI0014518B85|nr:rhodanese-like domain-containing protein [Marinobacterium sp. LSUCC0821]QJD71719.1 rhodanese-like domain-containing protein [Marinobacterium sp. LSUCC0821]
MMRKAIVAGLVGALATGVATFAAAEDKPVGITGSLMSIEVMHNGQKVEISRNADNQNQVNPSFALTSRPCPPFCIQPMSLAPGVETIGEVEMLGYLDAMSKGDDSILVIDSRTPDWAARGMIPGAVNLPWTKLNTGKGADPISISEIFTEQFGATEFDGLWKFGNAKTLVMYCNGMWCGQSPTNIKSLLDFGYPADKIKWYRGGMQNWENLGLTTVKP